MFSLTLVGHTARPTILFQMKTAIIAPITDTIIPGMLRVAEVSTNCPVDMKVAIIPPTKAPIIPRTRVPNSPPPLAAGSIALAIAPAIKPNIIQAIMFIVQVQ